jgi:glycosyltransferase involved in cell wall biosynthesis
MKILHICGTFEKGGIKTLVHSLINLNNENKSRHDLLVLSQGNIPDIPLESRIFQLGNLRKNPIKNFFSTRKIFREYDALMVHKALPVLFFPLMMYRNKKFIFQHGMTVSRGSYFKRLIKRIWYSLIPVLVGARVICSTEFAFHKARKNGIKLSWKRVDIVPFGITLPQKIKNRSLNIIKDGLIVGSLGVFSKIKRFDWLIKSLEQYSGKLKIKIILAGNGPEKDYLKNLAENINRKKVSIVFPDFIEDVDEFYDHIDLLVFPSHDESFGLVVPEAISRGVPVAVFSDLGGSLSLVQDLKNGFILKSGVSGLESFWKKLNADPEILNMISANIKKMDLKHFDIRFTREKLESLV